MSKKTIIEEFDTNGKLTRKTTITDEKPEITLGGYTRSSDTNSWGNPVEYGSEAIKRVIHESGVENAGKEITEQIRKFEEDNCK